MRPNRQHGFTLVEILFATFILAGALLVLAATFTNSTRFARAGDTTTHVVFTATEVIELETARIKTAGSPDLVCGTTTEARQHNGVPYTVQITLAKLTLDPATGELSHALDGCAEPHPDAYQLNLVLSWVQDGVSLAEAYREVIATNRVRAPVLDYFRAESGATHFLPAPDLPTTLAWQTTIGTQPLDVAITGSDGSQYRDLKHTDQLTLAPSRSTRYQISVSNSEGAQARAATIFVDDIDIASFEPSPPIVGPDEPFELTWTYTAPFDPEFETATIHPDIGDVSGRTVTSAGPIAGDTTYTLLLEDRDLHNGPHQLDAATTEVKYSSRPLVDRFEVTPERQCRAASGNSVELAWRVYAASAIYLNGAPIDRAGSQTLAITSTTDFMLHAENAHGVTEQQVLLAQLLERPQVSLTGNGQPGSVSIVDGTAALLQWSAQHATSAHLDGEGVPTSGAHTVEPIVSSEYAFTATNHDLCDETATLLVTIEPIGFEDVTFDQTQTTEGDTVTLSWGYDNTLDPTYHRVTLTLPDGSEHDVTNHTSYTAPATIVGANQFRLRLHDRHPERVIAEAAPSITAIPAPSITRFEASHAAVCHGDQSILSWATAHADTARLVGIGSVPANGTQAVTPTGTTTYTLEASNHLGFTVRSSVTVGHVPAPEIRSFRPALSPIAFAAGTHLFWSIIGADRVSIDRGIGSVTPGNGGARVTPKSTTTYTLRAEAGAPSGPESCVSERTATVQVENIDITHFAGRFPGIPAKGRQILEWEITPYIDPIYHRVRLTGPRNDLDVSGADHAEVVVETNRGGSTLPFTLTVYDRSTGAELAKAATSLQVVKSPEIDELTVTPTATCKASAHVSVRYDFRSGAGVLTWPDNPDGLFLGETFEPKIKGTRTINLTRSSEVTLKVTSMAGEVVEETRQVHVNPPPLLNNFYASRTSIIAGQDTTLNWSVSGASNVTINGESVPNTGSLDVRPLTNTPYTLLAETPGCPPLVRSATVNVTQPTINELRASPSTIPAGGSATLHWQVTHFNPSFHTLHLSGVGEIHSTSGNHAVRPTGWTQYRLEVRARHNGEVITSRAVAVNVH